MSKTKKIIFGTIAAVLVLLTAFTTMAFALTGDGNTYVSGGGGHAVSGGYKVKDTTTDAVMGYRFTWLKGVSSGGFWNYSSIDVYYNDKRPTDSSNGYPFHLKATINGAVYRNVDKYTYKNNYDNLSITAESSNTYCTYYQESDISGLSLPTVSNMPTWGKENLNINRILGKMQTNATVSDLSYTDYVLIEPIFAVRINEINYSITLTEIGLLGCNIIGEDSIGNVGDYNGGNWATIYKYTNGAFASYLYTSDYDDHSDLGIANGSALSTSSQTTFKNLVDKGYGLMVCWNVAARTPIKVYYRINGGTPSSTYSYSSYGTLKTKSTDTFVTLTVEYGGTLSQYGLHDVTTFGLTRTGYTLYKGWWYAAGSSGASKQFSDSYSYAYSDLRPYAVTNSSGGLEVYMLAQWTANTYTNSLIYNANGGTGAPSTDTKTVTYPNTQSTHTISSTEPTRSGYTFAGWYTAASGGTKVETSTTVGSNNTTSNQSKTIYAHWSPITYQVKYYLDGVEQTSLKQTCEYGESYTYPTVPASTVGNDSHKVLVSGWYTGNTADTKGTQYTAGASFKNLSKTDGDVINRYAYSYVKVIYRTNGGTVGNTTYTDNGYGSIIYNDTNRNYVSQTLYYGQQLGEYGLWDGASFKLNKTGYTFNGWLSEFNDSTEFNESTRYDYDDFKNLVCDKYGLVYLKAKWVPARKDGKRAVELPRIAQFVK